MILLTIYLAGCTGIQSAIPTSVNSPSPTSSQPTSILISNTPLPPPSSQPRIIQFQMIDRSSGWAVQVIPGKFPIESIILHTTNGISSWRNVTPPLPEGNFSFPIFAFIDQDIAVGIYIQRFENSSTTEMTAWRTADGGKTWKAGETTKFDKINDFSARQLTMINQENGWMLGTSNSGMEGDLVIILETKDGGMHWGQVYDTNSHRDDPQNVLWIIGESTFSDQIFTISAQSKGYFTNSRLSVSNDGGKSWQPQPLNPPSGYPNLDIYGSDKDFDSTTSVPQFSTPNDGVLIRRIFRHDQVISPPVEYQGLPQAQFIYYTHDKGETWISQPAPVKLGTIYFRNANTGWFLGKNDPDPTKSTQLYQTVDGGKRWIQIVADCLLPLGSEIQFLDEQTGFAFDPFPPSSYYAYFDLRTGKPPYLFTTANGGKTWDAVEPQLIP